MTNIKSPIVRFALGTRSAISALFVLWFASSAGDAVGETSLLGGSRSIPIWIGTGPLSSEAERAVPAELRSAQFRLAPLVRRTAEGEKGLLLVTVDSTGLKGVSLEATAESWPGPQSKQVGDLGPGQQRVEWEIPAITKPVSLRVKLAATTASKVFENIRLKPPRQWTIYLTQHTHTDIGYTRPQTEILPEHLRYIDYALDYCDATDKYPDDARFRWTCETAWAVREYLQRRPPEQIQRLKKRLQEGRLELTGMLLNMSEIATESSLAASLQPLRGIKEQLGLTVRSTMQDDVNGAAWCLADYFSAAGIKYLSMGINKTRSLLPFNLPTPFWWESPSGKRVLAYRSDHYMTANFWQINQGQLPPFRPGVLNYLLSLEERGYPFDRVGVQFSGYYTDNSPPSTVGSDVVKLWNEAYAWPRLRISTIHEFLEYVEKEHGSELSVHRQAWPDWWTDGFGSAARETAASRQIHAAMQVNENLLAMAAMLGAVMPRNVLSRSAAIQEDLLFYDEHTFGAAESISDPLAENSQVQWGEKGSYAWSAVKNANLLREEAMGLLQEFVPRAEVPTLAVFNTLSWPRSGLLEVFIDHQILPTDRAFRLVDAATGDTVPAQPMSHRAEGTYWALWVKDVPPLGYKVIRIQVAAGKRTPDRAPLRGADGLENRFYSLKVDPQKGIRSLVDKETGQELVDPNSLWGLGQCIYETLPAKRDFVPAAFKRTSWRHVQVRSGAQGPVWRSLLLTADLDGCVPTNGLRSEIRLYDTEKRVELHFDLRKLPVTTPEAVYVSFPFRCAQGKLRYEAQGGLVTPGENQIPGSSSDWQTIQDFISIRNRTEQVVFGSDQAPLVQLGDFNLGKWQPITKVDRPHIYSWVMNNYWFTNFRASQEGEFKWSYYLTSTQDRSNTFATRFGWGSRIPLVARVFPAGKAKEPYAPMLLSSLKAEAPNVILVDAKPAAAGDGVVLHLREVEGKAVTIGPEVVTASRAFKRVDEVNVLEEVLQSEIPSLPIGAFEVKFVKLVF